MNLCDKYRTLTQKGLLTYDEQQAYVCNKLEQTKQKIEAVYKNKNLLSKIFLSYKKHDIKGLYLYGDVGRGKSMLMDLFFGELQVEDKKRIHFHEFMLRIHKHLHKIRGSDQTPSDPIKFVAQEFITGIKILCLDELQVTDITDAMILERLFSELLRNNVVVVITSNRHPDDLYKDGLQRENFLPFIKMIKRKLQVQCLDAKVDYRLQHLKALQSVYHFPLGKKANIFLKESFKSLTSAADPIPYTLLVAGRELTIAKTHADIAWTSFKELCEKPLGAADYIEIAQSFGTLLLEDIPCMNKEKRNEAKRFVTLIDELYEKKVKLICTAQVAPDKLYVAGDGSFEFNRTVSRLMEMQTEKYLCLSHETCGTSAEFN